MATLEEASRQLTEEIGEWEADVQAATARFGALSTALRQRETALETAVARLESEVAEFVGRVQEETRALQKAIDEAHQATSRAEQAVKGAGTAATGALAAGEEGVHGLTETLGDLPEQLERIVTRSVETPAEQLGEQARSLAEALETAFDDSGANVEAFTQTAAELQSRIPSATDGMGKALKESDEGVGEAFVEWTSHLFEVVDLVTKQGFKAIDDNAEAVASYAMGESREALDAEAQRAIARTRELDGTLDSVGDAIEDAAKTEVQGALEEPLRTELEDLESAIGESVQWLKEIQQWLAEYSFMQA
jgi:predicted  nucleic acid-binding Zn-ribbon protein